MTVYYDKGSFTIRDANPDDIEIMEGNLRKEEIDELYASDHFTPHEGLSTSFSVSSICCVLAHQGKPFAMFGIVPDSLLGRTAQVWLLTTNDLPSFKTRFLKASRAVIKGFLRRYSLLYNYVDARHRESIKWLEWCGARLTPAKPYGAEGLPFHQFFLGGQ